MISKFDNQLPEVLRKAHKHSCCNKEEVMSSDVCGCFYCLRIFTPNEIEQWIGSEKDDNVTFTAVCPYCNIDSVIGSKSGFLINESLLNSLHKFAFNE